MNVLVPRMSEKSFKLSQERNTYVFNVPLDMNRTQVADAIKAQYSVEVVDVTIAIAKGKAVRHIRKGGRVNVGTRANVKKAYVRLAVGNSLPIFAAVEEEIKSEKDSKSAETPEKAKRGIFGRKNEKATKAAGAATKVTRTQAMVGEK